PSALALAFGRASAPAATMSASADASAVRAAPDAAPQPKPAPAAIRATPERIAEAQPVPVAGSYEKHEIDDPKEPVVREGRVLDLTTSPAAVVAARPAASVEEAKADAPRLVQASPEVHQVQTP